MVAIASLTGEPSRGIDIGHVGRLALSIDRNKLLNPVTATPDGTLVAGFHRVEAYKLLGRTHIPADVRELTDLECELIQIEENVRRLSLTTLQMSVQLTQAQKLYEVLYPVTKAGSSEKHSANRQGVARSERQPAFATATAAKTNKSERTVQRLTHIGKHLNPDAVELLTGSEIEEDGVRLTDISLLPQHEQVPVVSLLLSEGGPKTVTGALRLVRGEQTPSDPAGSPATEQASGTVAIQPSVLHRASASACEAQGIDLDALGITVADAPDRPAHVRIALPAPSVEPHLLTALRIINELDAEISRVKSILTSDAASGEWKQLASPADLAMVPAGQMRADWLDDHSGVQISRGGVPLAQIPAKRVPKSGTYIKSGNTKTESVISIINGWSQGCGRGGTGLAKCETCCFCSNGDFRTGCFAADTAYTNHAELRGIYDICLNGLRNNLQKLCLPRDGSFVLNADPAWGPIGRRISRVDSESSDVSLSVATGLLQVFAEQNEQHLFYGISSNYFHPSNAMLRWLCGLDNVWVLHSVSACFDSAETEMRFAAIERFLEYGVPTAISLVTDPSWPGNEAILERALKLVPAEAISEAPHQIGKQYKHLPMLGINPLGACGDNRFDHDGHLVHGEYAKSGKIRYFRDDTGEPAHGASHPRCVGCRILCGATALGFCDTANLAPPPLVLDGAAGDAATGRRHPPDQ